MTQGKEKGGTRPPPIHSARGAHAPLLVGCISYLDTGPESAESSSPRYFVIALLVSGQLHGLSLPELAAELCDRLAIAFDHLAQGNLLEAQTVAADTRLNRPEAGHTTPHRAGQAAGRRQTGHEGQTLGGDYRLERKLAK